MSPSDVMPNDVSSNDVVARCAGIVQIYRASSGEVTALRGIDAQFRRGEMTAVMGPSGSGKSTLLRLLALVEQATGGELTIAGVATQTASARQLRHLRGHIGVVLQRPTHNLFEQLTVAEHVQHIARRRRTDVRVAEVLAGVGLDHRHGNRPSQLSGGEQQRLSVAVATLGAPALVLADEPTAELDAENSAAVVDLLRRAAHLGSAVFLNTHDPHVAAAADTVLALRHGILLSERRSDGTTMAVIDSVGRVQLPLDALEHFPDHRAVVVVDAEGAVTLRPPTEEQR